MMRSENPVLNEKAFSNVRSLGGSGEVMTIDGTVNRSIISVAITTIFACLVYANPKMIALAVPFMIVGMIVGLVVSFKPTTAPLLTPVYAGAEGTVLGCLSWMFEARFPGIVFEAILLTLGVLFSLLMMYKSGRIQVSDRFRRCVTAATAAIFFTYLLGWLLSLFGVNVSFLYNSSPISIVFSLIVVGVASLNLVQDFDMIERGAHGGLPKYMEWYGAFGLLVTLVWLYISILQLLGKLQDRR